MRLKPYIAALVFLIGTSCFAQGTLQNSDVRSTPGPVVPGALITVCTSPATSGTIAPCTPKANIFVNAAMTLPSLNPITADGNGNYNFYAPAGTYVISVTGRGLPGRTYTIMLACAPSSTVSGCGAGPNLLITNNNFLGTNNFNNGLSIFGNLGVATSGPLVIGDCGQWISILPPVLGDTPCSGGGGSGTVVASPQYQIGFFPTAGTAATVQGSGLTTDSTHNNLQVPGTTAIGGPNPYVDTSFYGMRAVASPFQTTATCTATSPAVSLAVISSFQNGDGINLYGCGATVNSGSLATPGAPTVTPSVASGPDLGIADVVNAPTGGANSGSYQIVARTKNGGMTPAGSAGTTSTAFTLGAQQTTVTTMTRANNVVTVNTSAPNGAAVGGFVFLANSSDATFSGQYMVASIPSGTQMVLSPSGLDTRGGATASATGGIAVVFNCNHVTWAAVSGAWQYYIYSGGTLVGVTAPGVTSWNDYGATLSALPSLPDFVPSSAPVSYTNEYLATTILSGAGTTSITIATNALQNNSGGIAKFDDGPNLVNAFTAAVSTTKGALRISTPAAGLSYFINSHTALPTAASTVMQTCGITLNETLEYAGGNWHGILGGCPGSLPQFAWNAGQLMTVGTAYPGIVAAMPTVFNYLSFTIPAQGLGLVESGGYGFNTTLDHDSFVINGTDYMGQAVVAFGMGNAVFSYDLFATNDSSGYGYSFQPIVLLRNDIPNADNSGNFDCEHCFFEGRGLGLSSNPSVGAGQIAKFDSLYSQAIRVPVIQVGKWNNLNIFINRYINDSSSTATLANLGSNGMQAQIWNTPNASTEVGGAVSIVTGNVIPGLDMKNSGTVTGQNRDAFKNRSNSQMSIPVYSATGSTNTATSSGDYRMEAPFHFPAQHTLYWDLPAPTGLSVSTSAGGAVPVGAPIYTVTAIGADGGETTISTTSATCTTTSGNQTCTFSWSPVTGATSYNVYRGGSRAHLGTHLTAASYIDTSSFTDGPTAPNDTGTGLTTIEQTQIFTPQIVLSGPLVGATSPTCTFNFSTNNCGWASTIGTVTNPGGNFIVGYPIVAQNSTTGVTQSPISIDTTTTAGGSVDVRVNNTNTAAIAAGVMTDARGEIGTKGAAAEIDWGSTSQPALAGLLPAFSTWNLNSAAGHSATNNCGFKQFGNTTLNGYGPAGNSTFTLQVGGSSSMDYAYCTEAAPSGSSRYMKVSGLRIANAGAGHSTISGVDAYFASMFDQSQVNDFTVLDTQNLFGVKVEHFGFDSQFNNLNINMNNVSGHTPFWHNETTANAGGQQTVYNQFNPEHAGAGAFTALFQSTATTPTLSDRINNCYIETGNADNHTAIIDVNGALSVSLQGCTSQALVASMAAPFVQIENTFNSGVCLQNLSLVGTWTLPAVAVHNLFTGHDAKTDANGNFGLYCSDPVYFEDLHVFALEAWNYAAATGSVNVLVSSTPLTSQAAGTEVHILPNNANTTINPTLNVGGLGAMTITKNGTANLTAGDLTTTAIADLVSDGTNWQLQNPQTGGGGGGSGTVNPGSQFSIPYYVNAGSANVVGPVNSPSSPNGVTYFLCSTPSGGSATAPTFCIPGVPGRTVAGATDTILSSDRTTLINYTDNSAVAVGLPQAGSSGFGSNFPFTLNYTGNNQLTVTPTTSTINGSTTMVLGQNDFCFIYSIDNANYLANCTNGNGTTPVVADSGSANAYVISYPLIQTLQKGAYVYFTAGNANTGASTINVNGFGVKALDKNGATALLSGDINTTSVYFAIYDGTQWQVQNASTGSFGTFTAHKFFGNNTASTIAPAADSIGSSDVSPNWYAADSGIANAYVVAPTPAVTALTTGATIFFTTANANSGASTINVSSLGVKALDKKGSTALVTGDILATAIYQATYDGTEWQLANPSTSAGGSGTVGNCSVAKSLAYYSATGTTTACLSEADASQYQYVADSGAANAYVMTLAPALAALNTGNFVSFTTTHPNTTASTVNVNGLGVKAITKNGTTALAGGEIVSGEIYTLEWDGTEWQLLNPSTGCANCVLAVAPGAGIAHFAGSTQTVTSSAVSLTADVSGVAPTANGGTGSASPGTNAAAAWTVSDTTFTNATTAIGGNACSASAVTVTMTGVTTSMTFSITPSVDISGSTGWGSTGGLVIDAWPTSNTLNYKICNQTGTSITPAAVTWNVSAR